MISAKTSMNTDQSIKKANQFLAEKNPHLRDKHVNFKATGVTKLCVFKYPYEHTNASAMHEGTVLHNDIETYFNNGETENESKEFLLFKKFAEIFKSEPYRTEWLVYSENAKIIGTIDMVVKNKNNTYSIYDWKRTVNVEANSDSMRRYTLQLNLYRYILESEYDMIIEGLFLLLLHPENETHIEIPIIREKWSKADIKMMTQEFSDSRFKKHVYSDVDAFIGYSCQDSTELTRLAINSKSKILVVAWSRNLVNQYRNFPPYIEQMIVDGGSIGSIVIEIRRLRHKNVLKHFPDILVHIRDKEQSVNDLNFGNLKIS